MPEISFQFHLNLTNDKAMLSLINLCAPLCQPYSSENKRVSNVGDDSTVMKNTLLIGTNHLINWYHWPSAHFVSKNFPGFNFSLSLSFSQQKIWATKCWDHKYHHKFLRRKKNAHFSRQITHKNTVIWNMNANLYGKQRKMPNTL